MAEFRLLKAVFGHGKAMNGEVLHAGPSRVRGETG
jgi:hypothetical protein